MLRFQSPWLKRLLYIVIAACGLYLITGFLLIPALATFLAPRMAKDHLEGRVETGWIGLNPFTFTVSLGQTSWMGADDKVIAAFDRLEINADPMGSLFHRQWQVAAISLDNANVDLVVNADGSLNLLNAITKRPEDPTKDPETGATLPDAWLGLLEVSDLAVNLTDLRQEKPFQKEIAPVNFRLVNLRTAPGQESPYQFTAITGADESIALDGLIQLQPLLLSGELRGQDILLSEYTFYLSDTDYLELRSGRLDFNLPFSAELRGDTAKASLTKGRLALNDLEADLRSASPVALSMANLLLQPIDFEVTLDPDDGLTAEAGANLELNQFETTTKNNDQTLAAFASLTADDIALKLAPLSMAASAITLTRPDLFIERDTSGDFTLLNLLNGLQEEAPKPPDVQQERKPSASASPAGIHIDRFAINEARLRFHDASVDPVAAFTVNPIDFEVQPFSMDPASLSKAVLDATFEDSARIHLTGSLHPGNPFSDANAEMTIENIPLSVSSPYSLKFIGRPVEEGTFSGEFTYGLVDKDLTAENALVIDSIDFGPVSTDYKGKTYPVGMAIALLQNNQNKIAIDIPVSGSMADPQFNPVNVIRSVITGLLTKAITSPFNLVAAMTGSVISAASAVDKAESSETDYSRISFKAGQHTLTEAAKPVLREITEMLDSRPHIQLGIQGSFDPEADLLALQEERFRKRLADFSGDDRSDKLRRAYIIEILERDPDAPAGSDQPNAESARLPLPKTIYPQPVSAPRPALAKDTEPIPAPGETNQTNQQQASPTAVLPSPPPIEKTEPRVTRRGLRKFSRPSARLQRQQTGPVPPTSENTASSPPAVGESPTPPSQTPPASTPALATTTLLTDQSLDVPPSPKPDSETGPQPLPELPSDETIAAELKDLWFKEPPDLHQLAQQRAKTVRDYFADTGNIQPDRLQQVPSSAQKGPAVEFRLQADEDGTNPSSDSKE